MNSVGFSVETSSILKECERNFSSGASTDQPGIVMGLRIIRSQLFAIGARAIELGDAQLIDACRTLCIVRETPEDLDLPTTVGEPEPLL